MRFVGIDPSLTRTGVSIIEESGKQSCFSIKTNSKNSDLERQIDMAAGVLRLLQLNDVCCMEDFGIAARKGQGGKFAERLEICGMIKGGIRKETRMPFLTCPPNVLKMWGAGVGSADKPRVLKAVQDFWGVDAKNYDEADAAVMALISKYALLGEVVPDRKRIHLQKFEDHGMNRSVLSAIRSACAPGCTSTS